MFLLKNLKHGEVKIQRFTFANCDEMEIKQEENYPQE
jgi:hypothetical protein